MVMTMNPIAIVTALIHPDAYADVAASGLAFAHELADIDHAVVGHVGKPGVAYVGVVRPEDRFGIWPVKIDQAVERFHHMQIAYAP